MKQNHRYFTLVEMLVVIAIISILAAILIPAIQKVVALTEKTHCQSNMRQLGMAMHMRANDYRGKFYITWNGTSLGRATVSWNWHYDYKASNHDMVKEYVEYMPNYDVFLCPNAAKHSFWDERHDLHTGDRTVKEQLLKINGRNLYWQTMFDTDKGGERWDKGRRDTSFKGCHRWAPSPEHPSHTWTYFCPGHNAVSGQNPLELNVPRHSSGYVNMWKLGWKTARVGYNNYVFKTLNVLYVDGHVKFNDFRQPGNYSLFDNLKPHGVLLFIDDGCHWKRGNSCKR